MNTELIKVENLKCNGCASTIKKGLLKYGEVNTVNIDVVNSTVEVNFEGGNESLETFKTKLSKMGYPEVGKNSSVSVAKSFYSCAIGRIGEIEE